MKKNISSSILLLVAIFMPIAQGNAIEGSSISNSFGCPFINDKINFRECGSEIYFYDEVIDGQKILYSYEYNPTKKILEIEIPEYFNGMDGNKSYRVSSITGMKYNPKKMYYGIFPEYLEDDLVYKDKVGKEETDFLGIYFNERKLFSYVDYDNTENRDTEEGRKLADEFKAILYSSEPTSIYEGDHAYDLDQKIVDRIDQFVDGYSESKTDFAIEKLSVLLEQNYDRVTLRDDIKYELIRYLHQSFRIKKFLNNDGILGYLDYFEDIR